MPTSYHIAATEHTQIVALLILIVKNAQIVAVSHTMHIPKEIFKDITLFKLYSNLSREYRSPPYTIPEETNKG